MVVVKKSDPHSTGHDPRDFITPCPECGDAMVTKRGYDDILICETCGYLDDRRFEEDIEKDRISRLVG